MLELKTSPSSTEPCTDAHDIRTMMDHDRELQSHLNRLCQDMHFGKFAQVAAMED